ncbi:MAG: TAXI family TRAP transporter solute-binding subunit [Pseudomonadota bacterium]
MLSFGNRTTRASIAALVASVTLGAAVAPSMAADPREINRGRIGLLTGSASGTGLSIAADLARVLDGKSNLRIVPYLSSGSVANIEDLTSFRFADMALINSDALLSQRLRNPDDERLNNINYVARLFTNEVHVITRADSGIDSLSDLVGRRFAAGEARSGTFLTASLLLRATGVRATAIAMPTDAGFDALADGTVDAVFMLAAKPSAFLRKITSEENLALVQVPITENIRSVYKPGEFTSVDYPGLVRDKFVETVSVDVILAAYGNAPEGSDKYRRIHAFVSELERNGAQFLRPPSHPKWQQFSFDEEVGDLPRNAAAVAALSGEEAVKTDRPSILDLMRQGVDQ